MHTKTQLLVLASKNNLLYCTGLAEALGRNETFSVDVVENPFNEISVTACVPRWDLVLCFGPGPVFRLNKLRTTGTKLLLVLDVQERLALRHLLALGVDGAITSEASFAELLLAIETIALRRLKYISPFVASLTEVQSNDSWASLSQKEHYIALGVTQGKRNIDMATDLNISPKTVNTYKSRIYRKLGVSNDMQLLKLTLGQISLNNVQ